MSGKGSDQRPTDHKKFSENYDLIFKNKNEQVQDSPSAKRSVAKIGDNGGTSNQEKDSTET